MNSFESSLMTGLVAVDDGTGGVEVMGAVGGFRAARKRAVEGEGVEVDSVAGMGGLLGTDSGGSFVFFATFYSPRRSAKVNERDLRKKTHFRNLVQLSRNLSRSCTSRQSNMKVPSRSIQITRFPPRDPPPERSLH